MATEPAGAPIQIGQDGRGVIGQTVIGATVIYGSVTIIQGSLQQEEGQPPQSVPEAEDDEPNPYQGLLAFQPGDGDRFFGREGETEELRQRFCALHHEPGATRLLVVFGPSGSGKSSLVRAGLVPALAKRPPGGQAQARIALLVPGSQPLHALAAVLARIATNDPAPAGKSREFAEELAITNGDGAHDGLRRLAALLPEADVWPLMVVVDQLEEIYSLCSDEGARQAFLANLLAAAADPAGRVSVVVTLRSDFLGATQDEPALNGLIKAQGVFVAALSEAGMREAIRRPALDRRRPLDDAVVDLLVKESLGRDGALPLLQFALLRIWEGMRQGQPPAETLRAIGGVGGSLAGEADRLYQNLSDDDQSIARRLFLSLVQLGEGISDTRRRVALSEVLAHGDDSRAVRRVSERFANKAVRLITRASAPGPTGVEETLELTHEALIEAWPRLRDWLSSDRTDLRFQRRLEDSARHWDAAQRPEGSLWRPPDLDLLERFRESRDADLTPRQLAFAEASRQAERSRTRKEQRTQALLRGGLVTLSGLTVLALGFGGLAWHQLRQAQAAQALQFEANHRALVKSDPFASVVYGLAAAKSRLNGKETLDGIVLGTSLSRAASAGWFAMPSTNMETASDIAVLRNRDVLIISENGSLQRWRNGRSVGPRIISGHASIRSFLELKNGDWITTSEEGTLQWWHDGKRSGYAKSTGRSYSGDGRFNQLVESEDGQVISVGREGNLHIWRNGERLGKPFPSGQTRIHGLVKLRNGGFISVGEEPGHQHAPFYNYSLRWWRNGRLIGGPIYTGQRVSCLLETRNGELVSGGADGSLIHWLNGKVIRKKVNIGLGHIFDIAELKDDVLMISGVDGRIRQWHKGKPVGEIINAATSILRLRDIGNGEILMVSADGLLHRWRDARLSHDIRKPISSGEPGSEAGEIETVVTTANGTWIAAGRDGALTEFRGSKKISWKGRSEITNISKIIEVGHGEIVLSGTQDTELKLQSLSRSRQLRGVLSTGQDISGGAMVIRQKNGDLITGGSEASIRRWLNDKPLGEPIITGQWIATKLLETKNGDLIVAGRDGVLRRWRKGKEVGKPINTHQGGWLLKLEELEGGTLGSYGADGSYRLWKDNRLLSEYKKHPYPGFDPGARNYALLNDGKLMLSNDDGTIDLWQGSKRLGRPIPSGQGAYPILLRMPNGDVNSGGREDGSIRRWRNGRALGEKTYSDLQPLQKLFLLPGGDVVAFAYGNLQRWQEGKSPSKPMDTLHASFDAIALRNGEIVTSGPFDTTLRIWRDGKLVGQPIATGQKGLAALIGLRNGQWITAGRDGTLRWWRNGKPETPPIDSGQKPILSLIELSNGDVVSGGDGSIRFWRKHKPAGEPVATRHKVLQLLELKNGDLLTIGNTNAGDKNISSFRPVLGNIPSIRRWRNGKSAGFGSSGGLITRNVKSLTELSNGSLLQVGWDGKLYLLALEPVVVGICRSIDLESGSYPQAMQLAREAARSSCRKVGIAT